MREILIYDKRDDLIFPFVNYPYLCENIPALPATGFMFHNWSDALMSVQSIRIFEESIFVVE